MNAGDALDRRARRAARGLRRRRCAHGNFGKSARPGSGEDAVYVCTTVEGNTNHEGAREGRLTLQKTRRFSVRNGDRFIRWTKSEQAEAA